MPIVVVAVVFMAPITLVEGLALRVVIVVRLGPVSASVRRPLPHSMPPLIPSAAPKPVAIDPGIAWTRHRRPHLVAQRWRSRTDVYADSGKGGSRECRSQDQASYPFGFHRSLSLQRPYIQC